jgi:hypothetical protein
MPANGTFVFSDYMRWLIMAAQNLLAYTAHEVERRRQKAVCAAYSLCSRTQTACIHNAKARLAIMMLV